MLLKKISLKSKQWINAFIHYEFASTIILVLCTVLALGLANSPFSVHYQQAINYPMGIQIGTWSITKSVQHWINEGLMSIFFLLVGLELKRELLWGELSTIRAAALPLIGALGGMIVPAVIYLLFNPTFPMNNGWGIPMATDIAFSIGILVLFAKRLPPSLLVFLVALAIIDDLGAVIVIACFYVNTLKIPLLSLSCLPILILIGLNIFKRQQIVLYLIIGTLLWMILLESGLHATLAGVLLALAIPTSPDGPDPLRDLESKLHVPVTFIIVPLFALFNAGVGLTLPPAGLNSITLGIALGLCCGKAIGISGFCWLAVRCKLAHLPRGAHFGQLIGVALIAGIGFTMSLFIAELAFPNHPVHLASAKIGILLGSALSAMLGISVLLLTQRIKKPNKTL